jgi:hypothetical protein
VRSGRDARLLAEFRTSLALPRAIESLREV